MVRETTEPVEPLPLKKFKHTLVPPKTEDYINYGSGRMPKVTSNKQLHVIALNTVALNEILFHHPF